MDVFSKRKRSEIMSLVRSKGNLTTEWRIRSRLIRFGISGWKTNYITILGKPDFIFLEEKVAVFIDGCFWHGCNKCRNIPSTNKKFWLNKIEKNQSRDRLVTRALKKDGWQVIRFWEHQVRKDPMGCVQKIAALIKK